MNPYLKVSVFFSLSLFASHPVDVSAQILWENLAGDWAVGHEDGPVSTALFTNPSSVAVAPNGDLYVAEPSTSRIRKVSVSGEVSTVAGVLGVSAHLDGPVAQATFKVPIAVAVGPDVSLYVADRDSHVIRKVSTSGQVTTLAGSPGVSGSESGAGGVARFQSPKSLEMLPDGSLVVLDSNYMVRRITPDGTVSVIAGDGTSGTTDGTGTAARFSSLRDVCVEPDGTMYVSDSTLVRRISSGGVVTTVATLPDSSYGGVSADVSGGILISTAAQLYRLAPTGELTSVAATTVGDDGTPGVASVRTLSFASTGAGTHYFVSGSAIRKMESNHVVSTVVGREFSFGSRDGTGRGARFNQPDGIAVDRDGFVYVSDRANNTIRKISPTGEVVTLAGSPGSSGRVNGKGSAARFNYPRGLCVDAGGAIYVSERNNRGIRKVLPDGTVSDFIDTDPAVDVVMDSSGHVFWAALENSRVGRMQVGDYLGMNFPEVRPIALAINPRDELFVIDYAKHRILKAYPNNSFFQLAGTGSVGSADGVGSGAAFNYPVGVAADAAGNAFVADTLNNTIRKISPAGKVTTIGGRPGLIGPGIGMGTSALFYSPTSLAVGADGTLYVANKLADNIVKGTPVGPDLLVSRRNPDGVGLERVVPTHPLRMPQTSVGSRSTLELVVANAGRAPLTGVSTVLTGAGFSCPDLPLEIAPGASTSLTVTCVPQAAGISPATLRILSNDPGEPDMSIPISLSAVAAGTAGAYSWELLAGSLSSPRSVDGKWEEAGFSLAEGIAFGPSGNLFVADTGNRLLRIVRPEGRVESHVGMIGQQGTTNGFRTDARLLGPFDVCGDPYGNLYMSSNSGAYPVRMLSPDGMVSTYFTPPSSTHRPGSVFFDRVRQRLLVGDTERDVILEISEGGSYRILAGSYNTPGSTDGPAEAATFRDPSGIGRDSAGNLYICDRGNHTIRKLDTSGVVSTYAGTPGTSGNVDGPGGVAIFHTPTDLAVGADDSLFVANKGAHTIRKISAAGMVSTIGGMNGVAGAVEGVESNARFSSPTAIDISPDGRVHVMNRGHILRASRIGAELAVLHGDGQAAPRDSIVAWKAHLDTPEVQQLLIRNTGTSECAALTASLTGAAAAEYILEGPFPTTLAAGECRVIKIRFAPAQYGARAADLEINGGEPGSAPYVLHLQAIGMTRVEEWRQKYFATTANTGIAAGSSDPDQDGRINLLEYAFGTHPLAPSGSTEDGSEIPAAWPAASRSDGILQMEFVRRREQDDGGLVYEAQFSDTLSGGWATSTIEPRVTRINDKWERVVVVDSAGGGHSRRFARVRITQP